MNSFFDEQQSFAQRIKKHRNAIYITIIVHLLVLACLLGQQIAAERGNSHVVMFDFSKEFAKEKEEKRIKEKEDVAKEVEKLFNEAKAGNVIRNVAVNTEDLKTSVLKDAKGINESVYEDAKLLQDKLDATREEMEKLQTANNDVPVASARPKQSTSKASYSGPSVISYTLEGRKAMSLPIPVYKCQEGGDVCVQIEVNQNGYVVGVAIVASQSSANECLQEAARIEAKHSRFTASAEAPTKQKGQIVYRFIAQQ